jgi:hypothetical protein
MTPKEAVAEGLADSILKPATKTAADEPAKANVDWSAFVASATEIGAV